MKEYFIMFAAACHGNNTIDPQGTRRRKAKKPRHLSPSPLLSKGLSLPLSLLLPTDFLHSLVIYPAAENSS